MHDGAPPNFLLAVRNSWTTAWPSCSPDLSSLDSYFWWHLEFIANAKAVRTCSNECRMDWEWFDWHLEVSNRSGSHCSNAQRPVLKPSVDTASILCDILEAVTRKLCFRSSVFIAYIFLVFGLDSLSIGLALNFFFHPVNNDVLVAESLLRR